MAAKLVVSISDLHLGRGTAQDSFVREPERLKKFGRELAAGCQTSGTELVMLLNGDVFDLWEIVPDKELEDDADAAEDIYRGLHMPVDGQAQMDALQERLDWALDQSLQSHPEFGDFVRSIAGAGASIQFNVGNHDHQLDNVRSEKTLIDCLRRRGGLPPAGKVKVARYYIDEALGFYAEHGDQFAGEESRSPLWDPNDLRFDEATGFYILRYVWNRLESRNHAWVQHADIRLIVEKLAQAVLGKGSVPIGKALAYMDDYFRAVKHKKIPIVRHALMQAAYALWTVSESLESVDMESVRPAALESMVAPEPVLEAAPFVEAPVPWLPGADYRPAHGNVNTFVQSLRQRYKLSIAPFPQLDRRKIRTVSLGHTHKPGQWDLFKDQTVTYLNTGSWTQNHELLYSWVYAQDGQPASSGVRQV